MDARTVVVGIDGTDTCLPALDWAADEALRRGARLEVVHLRDQASRPRDDGPVADAPPRDDLALLEMARDRVAVRHPEVGVEMRSLVDDPVSGLVARSDDAAVVVVGTHGRGWLGRLLHGSVSHGLARRTHCPVAVVRGTSRKPGLPVLVGVDGSPAAAAALRLAAEEARQRHVELVVAHAWAPTVVASFDALAISPELDADLEQYADHLLADAVVDVHLLAPEVVVTSRMLHGFPSAALVAESDAACLLVLGSRGTSTARTGFGSVTSTAIEESDCPVLVTPC